MIIKWAKFTWNNGEYGHTEYEISMARLVKITTARLENHDRLEMQIKPLLSRRPITIKAYVLADDSLLFFNGREIYVSENKLQMLNVFRLMLSKE